VLKQQRQRMTKIRRVGHDLRIAAFDQEVVALIGWKLINRLAEHDAETEIFSAPAQSPVRMRVAHEMFDRQKTPGPGQGSGVMLRSSHHCHSPGEQFRR